MTIGADLRRAREERGVSLREIADRTKIRVPVLRAIENDDFRSVPGGVILRGFLKLYAREVGLDPDEIARRCIELQAAETDATGTADGTHAAHPSPLGEGRSPLPAIVLGIALVAIAGGYFAWSRMARPAAAPVQAPQAAPSALLDAPPSTPAVTQPPPAEAPPAAVPAAAAPPASSAAAQAVAGALRVEVRATEACWLSATADGQQVAYRVLNAGDRVSLSVKDEAILRIGMPGNVTVLVNDAPVKPFARPGTPTTLRITPDNYRGLLAP